MYLEQNEHIDHSKEETLPLYESQETQSSVESDKIYDFIKSFEGLYLSAGRDEKKQIAYTITQALSIENVLSDDPNLNEDMINAITELLLSDPGMAESTRLVIQRFGK